MFDEKFTMLQCLRKKKVVNIEVLPSLDWLTLRSYEIALLFDAFTTNFMQ